MVTYLCVGRSNPLLTQLPTTIVQKIAPVFQLPNKPTLLPDLVSSVNTHCDYGLCNGHSSLLKPAISASSLADSNVHPPLHIFPH